jgi:hypothetical protein
MKKQKRVRTTGNLKKAMPKGFGGKIKGQGRKPAAIEMKAKEFMLACVNGAAGMEALIKKIYRQALKGNFAQQQLLLNYILGKPVDRLILEANDNALKNLSMSPVINIVASQVRLDRLEQDAKERVHDLERIKEAEVILEQAAMGAVQGGLSDGSVAQELEQKLKKA